MNYEECPFEIHWMQVTPEQAREWLEKHNPTNRALRQRTVDAMAQDMLANKWSMNHQALAFGEDGNLIDGQHRLAAIALSGRAQWFLVIEKMPKRLEGIEADVMDTIDRGNARSLADLLKLNHSVEQAPVIAAAALHIARLCVQWPAMQCVKATMSQTVGVLEQWREELRWLVKARPPIVGLRSVIIMGSLAFAHASEAEAVEGFLDGLVKGSCGKALRQAAEAGYFDAGSVKERRVKSEQVLACVLAWKEGKEGDSLPDAAAGDAAMGYFQKRELMRCAAVEVLFPVLPGRGVKSKPVLADKAEVHERAAAKVQKAVEVSVTTTLPPLVVKAGEFKLNDAAKRLLEKAGVR